MPGPVRYTKSGKVKQAAPRKYESGKGWSKLTPTEQAAPSVGPTKKTSRKRQVRKAVSRGNFGKSFEPTPTRRVSVPDTRAQNREALGPVGDALATVAKALQEPVDLPGTKLDRIGEILSILVAPRGALKGPSVGRAARFRKRNNPIYRRYTVANEQAGALGRAIRGRKGESIGKPWGPKPFDKAQAKANRAVRNRKKAQRKAALRNNIQRRSKRRIYDPNNTMSQRKVG